MDIQTGLDWVEVCKSIEIPENAGACVLMDNKQIAIFNFKRKNKWFACQNLCPHKQQMGISRGMIGSQGEEMEPKIACPFHKNTFSLETGKCFTNDSLSIQTYPVKEENGWIYISL